MNAAWLLRSRTLMGVLGASALLSTLILFFAPDGVSSLRKREAELREQKLALIKKARENQELAEEVRRLAAKDPELFEALARRQGFAKPGERVFVFKENKEGR